MPVHEEHLEASTRLADAGDVTVEQTGGHRAGDRSRCRSPKSGCGSTGRPRPVSTPADGAVFEEGTFEVPVSREEVDVSKRTVQTGEVQVTKEREQRTQKVTDSVRREVVDVDDTTVEGTQERPSR